MNPDRQKAAQRLYDWQTGGTSIACLLFQMIAKSDRAWRIRLKKGFPTEVDVYEEWQLSRTPEIFFHRYDLPSPPK